MPCRWVTIAGKRVRLAGPVGAATAVTQTGIVSPALRLAALGLIYASHSPGVSIEQLRKAVIRVWWNEERGYFAEARFWPGATPIYTALTPEQAHNLEGPEPDPSLIAMVFERKEPVDA
ncbi:MAG: hypothetical protein AMJ37_03605 [Dehalococcoidia bacterium DG_18]|nr:MAG: hypothetical protein AMJ37_03605 [Dehalococcoidia bacterium DG_18]